MTDSAPRPDSKHPLLEDAAQLEDVLDAMWATIHRVLNWSRSPRPRPGHRSTQIVERAIVGTGDGAEDILAEAQLALLSISPDDLKSTWGQLGVTIARRYAISALRRAGKGLRQTDHRAALRLVSGDEATGKVGVTEYTVFDGTAGDAVDPETEYIVIRSVLDEDRLARELLSERELQVFQEIHHGLKTRAQLGKELSISGQRVGQIYCAAIEKLEDDPRYPYRDASDEQGGA